MQVTHEVEELKLQKQRVQQEAKQLQAQVSAIVCVCFGEGCKSVQVTHEVEELKLQKQRVQQEAKQLQAQMFAMACVVGKGQEE